MKSRKWLSEIREEHKLTQKEVASKVGINTQYYAQIEQGLRSPSVSVAKRISKMLNFKWSIFFEDECSDKQQKSSA